MTTSVKIHHFDTDPFNWYVLEESSRLTVVDAGFPGHYTALRRGLESIYRTIKDVEAIIVTHAHADHMGFASRLKRETKAPVFVHHADLHALSRPLQLPWLGLLSNAWRPFMASTLTKATLQGVFWEAGIDGARGISDNDVLEVPGHPHVLHLPGHTPGQIALYLPAQRSLFSSDALMTRNLLNGRHGNPQLAHPILNHDTKQAQRSIDKLRDLGNVTLLPGHGQPWTGEISDALKSAF